VVSRANPIPEPKLLDILVYPCLNRRLHISEEIVDMQIVIVTDHDGQETRDTKESEQVNSVLLCRRRAICLSKEINDESDRVDGCDGQDLNSC